MSSERDHAIAMLEALKVAGVSMLVDPAEWVVARRRDVHVALATLDDLLATLGGDPDAPTP